jgi:hypothetical protein
LAALFHALGASSHELSEKSLFLQPDFLGVLGITAKGVLAYRGF